MKQSQSEQANDCIHLQLARWNTYLYFKWFKRCRDYRSSSKCECFDVSRISDDTTTRWKWPTSCLSSSQIASSSTTATHGAQSRSSPWSTATGLRVTSSSSTARNHVTWSATTSGCWSRWRRVATTSWWWTPIPRTSTAVGTGLTPSGMTCFTVDISSNSSVATLKPATRCPIRWACLSAHLSFSYGRLYIITLTNQTITVILLCTFLSSFCLHARSWSTKLLALDSDSRRNYHLHTILQELHDLTQRMISVCYSIILDSFQTSFLISYACRLPF